MADPTIITAGAASSFLLIVDQEGITHRAPKAALCDVVNSSNSQVNRLDICLANTEIILTFSTSAKLDTFLNTIDSHY